MTPEELNDLANRCEREEPSAALDAAIASACGWTCGGGRSGGKAAVSMWRSPAGGSFSFEPPRLTSSLDAAVTLVPEGAWLDLTGPRKSINIPSPVPNKWKAVIDLFEPAIDPAKGWGSTLVLAICAAALRARASKLQEAA